MDVKNLDDKLRLLGLLDREIPVYKVLLQLKQAKVSEIAELTGIYRPNVYTLLKDMIERGFVISNKGRVKTFRAVEPGTAFQSALEQRRRELTQSESILKELDEIFKHRRDSKISPEGIEVLTMNHVDLVLDWIRNTEHELLSIQNNVTPKRKALREHLQVVDKTEYDLLARNVKIRSLYTPEVISSPFEKKRISELINAGEIARCHPDIPMIFAVIDHCKAMFTVYSDAKNYTTYLATAPTLIHVFKLAFENLWDNAEPLTPPL
jgi:sugar-specific transcriptional regulator TrmB